MGNKGTPKAEREHSFALTVLNVQANAIAGHPRFMPVESDGMAPTLTFAHLAAVVPVSRYRGAGLYALDVLGQPDYARCEATGPNTIRLTRDNPRYGGSTMTLDAFEAALLGKVAGVVNVIDPLLLQGA